VLATGRARKNRTAPSSDYRNQRRPATTKEKLLSANTQPRLLDLAIKHTSTGYPPTSAIPPGQILGILLLASTTKENTNLTGSNSGRDHSSTTKRLGEQNIHHWRPVG
jgi:hypothetical protein